STTACFCNPRPGRSSVKMRCAVQRTTQRLLDANGNHRRKRPVVVVPAAPRVAAKWGQMSFCAASSGPDVRFGAAIHLSSVVTAIEASRGRIAAYCDDDTSYEADAAILTVPLPILHDISLPHGLHEKVTASTDIGFGNVAKILLRFT